MLSDADLTSLLAEHWGLSALTVTRLGGGMNSQAWRVEIGATSYVAKQVRADELTQLAAGCEVAARLAQAGIRTGRPVPTRWGALVVADPPLALLEDVVGRELGGDRPQEQRRMADTLADVHRVEGPSPGPVAADFFRWLGPRAVGVEEQPWLAPAIAEVRRGIDEMRLTWSGLHTDPAPEAFVHDEESGVTGLIDWAGARRGPVLYDVASAVMYLGGPEPASPFLTCYRQRDILPAQEWRHLDDFRRFRWAVQAAYFAGRLARVDLTGLDDQSGNERGLARGREGLVSLGVAAAS